MANSNNFKWRTPKNGGKSHVGVTAESENEVAAAHDPELGPMGMEIKPMGWQAASPSETDRDCEWHHREVACWGKAKGDPGMGGADQV
ncbi:hypothetical protein BN1708_015513 [Verticillium longisporum]|uniref:Uncharacterized protein n=1 Tax=Verticillium longisporum TaxID=100787 RepID=A0A0G4M4G7_VERLO|nr:hypothetical protein BN1708_015513 [Verticillium longisporum]